MAFPGHNRYNRPVDITAGADHDIRYLNGISVRETGGTDEAEVTLRRADGGGGATGQILMVVDVPAGETRTIEVYSYIPANSDGVHVELGGAGLIEGVLYEAK